MKTKLKINNYNQRNNVIMALMNMGFSVTSEASETKKLDGQADIHHWVVISGPKDIYKVVGDD